MLGNKLRAAIRYIKLRIALRRDHVRIAKGTLLSSSAKIGRYTRINAASHIGPCSIGAFCAIGGRLIVRSSDHYTNFLNMQEYFQRVVLGSNMKVAGKTKGNTCIGNAVWIGDSVIVLSGVTIGNGAVIGAGSIVTKDVPAYAIAVGNPARVIRYRFDPAICEKLESIKWWDWDIQKIKRNKHIFELDLERTTLDEFNAIIDKELK